jgi:N-methylhydantoinase B
MMTAMRTDPVTLEILKSYFVAIAEGMGYTLERTSHTTFIKESADFVTAVATPGGEFFAYPRTIGVSSFLGLDMTPTLRRFDYEPGDVIVTNDPYSTAGLATHLPDIHLYKPVFVGETLLCFAWCFIHCSDVGGLAPASISPRAYDIHQEGFRIPPRKLCRAGELDQEFLDLFLANCRIPEQNWGDLKAMMASLNTAETRMRGLAAKFGLETVAQAMEDMLDWSERRVRDLVRTIPDGDYAFADYLDDDLQGSPIRLAVTLKVRGENIELDYTGTDPQVNGALNLPAFGERHPFLLQGLVNFMLSEDPHIPLTGGIVRPFRVVAPKGCVVNPAFPAAVGVRYATVIRLYNVVLGALAQAVPARVPAAGAGQAAMVVLSAPDTETGHRDVTVLEPMFGGGGATRRGDGPAGIDSCAGFLKNTPVESMEAHIPVLAERYELLPGSAGAGQQRGGWGVRFDFRVLRPESIVTARGVERTRFEPWGLDGGHASQRTRTFVNPDTANEREIGRIDVLHLEPGEVVSIQTSGGGGYGDPLARNLDAVAADVRSGLLSPEMAEAEYGVVIEQGVPRRASPHSSPSPIAMGEGLLPTSDSRLPTRFDLGPSRRAYEAIWTPEFSDALATFLLTLPPPMRGYAKREIHRRIDGGAVRATPEMLPALWAEIGGESATGERGGGAS